MKTCPLVSVSRPATQCISVDFPEPDGPMMAVNRPGGELDVDVAERGDLRWSRSRRSWWPRRCGPRRMVARAAVALMAASVRGVRGSPEIGVPSTAA